MLFEVAILTGLLGAFLGLLEMSHRMDVASTRPLSSEAALRQAMRGPDGTAVEAEFRRRGVIPVARDRTRPGFGA